MPADLSMEEPGSLVPWDRNPRVNDHAVDRVARSIQRYGFGAPIVVRREDRRIIAGHTRWKAATRLALSQVPVRWMDLTEAEATALALADNRLGELADWQDTELAKLLHELQAEDEIEVSELGWTDTELDELLSQLSIVGEHTRGKGEEQRPDLRVVPGEASLLHGDCLHVLRDLPDDSVDAVVTDPPYGLSEDPDVAKVLQHWLAGETYEHDKPGFMGEDWDSFVPGPDVWRQVFRVLKPGGHLVCFAGTRTHDLMGVSIRLAGFQKRDLGEWLYWTGFPKSTDLAKLLDRRKGNRDEVLAVCAWVREARDAAGLKNADIDEHFGLTGMAAHWTSKRSQPLVPAAEQWGPLLELLGAEPPAEVAAIADRIIRAKGQPGEAWFGRKVVGEDTAIDTTHARPGMPGQDVRSRKITLTSAATPEAQRWEGWGTALKPAHEPWLLFRKPYELSDVTLADNALKWGTGGLNVDACAHADGDPMWAGPQSDPPDPNMKPRWPANAVHVRKPSQAEKQAGCEAIEPVTGAQATKRKPGSKGLDNPRAGAGRTAKSLHNDHKTVKPIRLMAWLVRLVTPPGGTVLDPFMGSGTTGVAAVMQGFRFTGIELRERFVQVAGQRIAYWKDHADDARTVIETETGSDEEDAA